MRDKILLIDGHSILHRAFYGVPDLTTAEGIHTNAVYGFLNILFKVLEEEKPGYLAVAFDLHTPTFRHEMYEAYKGTRSAMPDELREQVPLIKEMLSAMQIPLMMLERYEADDLIGTVSLQAEQAGMDVTILSGDRDLLQLCSDTTLVRIPKTKRGGTEVENYYAKDVEERYGVTPAGIIELKALMGDASDNIPGIPGVGEKTAAKIIGTYGCIEEAYAHVSEITPPRARTSLQEHYDLAQLSKTLATIDRHSPFTLDFEKARFDNPYTAEALTLCRKLEFKQFIPRFGHIEEKRAAAPYLRLEDDEEIRQFLKEAGDAGCIGISFLSEDSMPGRLHSTLYGIGLSTGEKTAYLPVSSPMQQELLLAGIISACRGKHLVTIGLKGVLRYLEEADQEMLRDAAVGAYLLNPLKGSYPYEDIAGEYMQVMLPSAQELLGKKKISEAVISDPDACMQAACHSAYTAAGAYPRIMARLREEGMEDLYLKIEMPLVFTLFDMEREGILVQSDALKAYGVSLESGITDLERRIYEQAGETFNINSPKQLGVVLFEHLGLKGGKKTKTGYSTAADVLEKLSSEYPVVADILSYRQLTKLKSTYADGLAAFISEDGRIHGLFHQTITATGRLSSADPNLQNIPVRTQLGRELRKVFVPAPGCVFIDADYSQIELRVLAHMSGDDRLIEAYREAMDIHAITASQVFHIPLDEVTSADRRNAKAVNFGIVYGISSFGLSQDLSISVKEASAYIQKYFETYPGIKVFLDGCVEAAKKEGFVTTLYGRKRPVPELQSANFMQRSFGERVAMNSPIQGTAADIIKIAMNRVHDRLRREGLRAKLILQVHDELLIEAPVSEAEKVSALLKEEMMAAADLKVALEVDVHTGSDWYEAK